MNYSLGEIDTLAKKAARGAGYSWGLAEDAGFAVRWLEARGLGGAVALAGVLQAMPDITAHRPDAHWHCANPLCPIQTGAALSDFAFALSHDSTLDLGAVLFPVLLIPFLANTRQVDLTWDAAKLSVSENGVVVTSALTAVQVPMTGAVRVVLSNKAKLAPTRTATRAIVAPDIYDVLNSFAAKTYAPATEESRIAGAGGASLTDND